MNILATIDLTPVAHAMGDVAIETVYQAINVFSFGLAAVVVPVCAVKLYRLFRDFDKS